MATFTSKNNKDENDEYYSSLTSSLSTDILYKIIDEICISRSWFRYISIDRSDISNDDIQELEKIISQMIISMKDAVVNNFLSLVKY